MAWIRLQSSIDESQTYIRKRPVTSQFFDLPVANSSSIATQFNDLTMVAVSQISAIFLLSGRS